MKLLTTLAISLFTMPLLAQVEYQSNKGVKLSLIPVFEPRGEVPVFEWTWQVNISITAQVTSYNNDIYYFKTGEGTNCQGWYQFVSDRRGSGITVQASGSPQNYCEQISGWYALTNFHGQKPKRTLRDILRRN